MTAGYKTLKVGANVEIRNVEGSTTAKGAKQNKTYTITEISTVPGFYSAVDTKGKEFTLWLITGKIGVQKKGILRMSYASDFTVNDADFFNAPVTYDMFKNERITRIDVSKINPIN